ncbi:MAG TPA: hypothetical protein PLP50_00340 [Thermoanaerobaculia bacterium]|jgi:hypothetical protein|nr:hypothetical protein [Thermoanaerobaculia bacterium]HQN06616.1 hypothetical protein [Thermoanaerobaculia bacterium]HQP84862.1 hypothetical protein [Thermoanaerobaculia bacterium]
MIKRRRTPTATGRLSGPLASDFDRSVRDLAAAVDALVPVAFALAWSPTENSPVFIQVVAVNGNPRTPPSGEVDPASPYLLALGAFPDGAEITISWVIRAFADLHGIRSFARTGSRPWERLDDKVPLQYQGQWKGESRLRVTP